MLDNRQLAKHLINKLVTLRFEYMDAVIGFPATEKMKTREADALYNCFVGGQVTINDLNEEIVRVTDDLKEIA